MVQTNYHLAASITTSAPPTASWRACGKILMIYIYIYMRYGIPGTRLHLKHLCPRGPTCSPGERQTKDLHIRMSMVRHGLHDVEKSWTEWNCWCQSPCCKYAQAQNPQFGGRGGGGGAQRPTPSTALSPEPMYLHSCSHRCSFRLKPYLPSDLNWRDG